MLIVTNLVKAGIPTTDDGIGTAFNFAEHIAFELFQCRRDDKPFDFRSFVSDYKRRFIIPDAILSRLQHPDYGIVSPNGRFRTDYMFFYFVGLFLSRNTLRYESLIRDMCDNIQISTNYLTLLFIIHHTNDNWIIEEILTRIKGAFESVSPATLTPDETSRFGEILDALSENILSDRDVATQRREIRDIRDASDSHNFDEEIESVEPDSFGSYCYKMFRSNGIMGQVLRNKYGILERSRVEEVIETVSDASLRVVNSLLRDEEEIEHRAHYYHRKFPEYDIEDLRTVLRFLSFLWTMVHIEISVESINHPEIRDVVDKVVKQKSTPAYELIGYISRLHSASELTEGLRDVLRRLLDRHSDRFVRGVLSLSTQQYMNTHRSKARVEQSVCSLLGLQYAARPI